jgi:hypothetical protein
MKQTPTKVRMAVLLLLSCLLSDQVFSSAASVPAIQSTHPAGANVFSREALSPTASGAQQYSMATKRESVPIAAHVVEVVTEGLLARREMMGTIAWMFLALQSVAAQNAPQQSPIDVLPLLIQQLDSSDGTARDAAIDELIQRGMIADQRGAVLAALENALVAKDAADDAHPHRRTAIIKIFSRLAPERAVLLANTLFGQSHPDAAELFARALRLTSMSDPRHSPRPRGPSAEHDLAQVGERWLHQGTNFPSHAALVSAAPWERDFLLLTHYLAVVSIENRNLGMFSTHGKSTMGKQFEKIIRLAELRSGQDGAADYNYKVDQWFLRPVITPAQFLFVTGHESTHNWNYELVPDLETLFGAVVKPSVRSWRPRQITATQRRELMTRSAAQDPELNAKAIDEFMADVGGVALLESVGLLEPDSARESLRAFITSQDLCVSCALSSGVEFFLDEAGRRLVGKALEEPRPGQWKILLETIRAQTPHLMRDTLYADFARTVVTEAWGESAWAALAETVGMTGRSMARSHPARLRAPALPHSPSRHAALWAA